jgi:hypothetical protein
MRTLVGRNWLLEQGCSDEFGRTGLLEEVSMRGNVTLMRRFSLFVLRQAN